MRKPTTSEYLVTLILKRNLVMFYSEIPSRCILITAHWPFVTINQYTNCLNRHTLWSLDATRRRTAFLSDLLHCLRGANWHWKSVYRWLWKHIKTVYGWTWERFTTVSENADGSIHADQSLVFLVERMFALLPLLSQVMQSCAVPISKICYPAVN